MNEHFKMLWDTYDFALNKTVQLEDEIDFLQDELKRYCLQQFKNEAGEGLKGEWILDIDLGEEIIANSLLKNFEEATLGLKGLYNKQLVSAKELKEYYADCSFEIPEDRAVSVDVFEELIEVTIQLKSAIQKSFENAKERLTS